MITTIDPPAALDPDADRLAQIAAQIIERVGEDAVRAYLPRIKVTPPRAGSAVLACARGRVLDADHMRWSDCGHSAVINQITCRDCAGRGTRAW